MKYLGLKLLLCLITSQSFAQSFPSDYLKQHIRNIHQVGDPLGMYLLDQDLGMHYEAIEASIPDPHAMVRGWPIEETQTAYSIIRQAFLDVPLNSNDIFYDLGSGHGRVVLYGAALYPNIKFRGIEFVSERVEHAKEMGRKGNFTNAEFILSDVLKADLKSGTVFYLFNPFMPEITKKVFEQLRQISLDHKITVIGHAGTSRQLPYLPWLKLIKSNIPLRLAVYESR